jgi:hypothetical protein
MEPLDVTAFRTRIAGRPYKELVEHHLRKEKQKDMQLGLQGTIALLPEWFLPAMEAIINEWNETARHADFWNADCAHVYDLITVSANLAATVLGHTLDDEALFNAFQVITLNLASAASESRELCKFAGIRKGYLG